MSLDLARVKVEPDWECGVSAAAAQTELYAGHEVKQELVLGPEMLQPPDFVFGTRVISTREDPEAREQWGADAGGTLTEPPVLDTYTDKHTTIRDGALCVEMGVKQESVFDVRNPPMVHIHSPCMGVDLNTGKHDIKQEPATTPKESPYLQTSQKILQEKLFRRLGIRPCTVHLVRVDEKISNKTIAAPVKNNTGKRSTYKHNKTPKQKKFTCDYCGKDFTMKASLLVHIRIHTGEKPFTCNVCSKRFSDIAILIRHRRIHTGEKPHTCDICNKHFSEKYLLRYHKRIHTGERPYACQYCPKKYNHISNLKRHTRIHESKPLTCEICDSHFSLQCKLEAHVLRHLEVKPFVCGFCRKCFAKRGHLNVHLRIHSDVKGELKEYSCAVCKAQFSQRSALKRHDERKVCRR